MDWCAQAAFPCCLSLFCIKKKYLVIGLLPVIENWKNFFMKRKFMDGAEYAKICGFVVKLLIVFFCCF